MTDALEEWPGEIWMAERDEHDQGVVSAVLSEHATVVRFDGDKERDREFHRYVDADIYESACRYYDHQVGTLRERAEKAEAETREAATTRRALEIVLSRCKLNDVTEPPRLHRRLVSWSQATIVMCSLSS